ncbi:MAG: nitroreductase family protein [Desulfobacterales bacterium]|nr:nitroreductase family protein [Desulfobacterales bacterium]
MNPLLQTLHSRTSVRKYTDRPLSNEELETLIKAGMAAPTAGNKQPWAFLVITEKETLKALADCLPYAGFTKDAPAAIVVCGDPKKGFQGEEEPLWIQDCSAATENILIACEAMGLGATWTAVHPLAEREESVRKILGIPGGVIPFNVIPVGEPAHRPKPKEKWNPDNLHWERWGS